MKTNSSLTFRSAVLAGLVLGAFTASAIAGPGREYWRNQGKASPTPKVEAAKPSGKAVPCTDSRTVAITETKNAQANGRGPLVTVQTGTKQVCSACAYPVVFMKPSGTNGRGPLQAVELPGAHDCVRCLVAMNE